MSTIKGYKPHENQLTLHNSIRKEDAKYYAFNIGRQFGKTMLCVNQMLDWGINNPNSHIAWVTPIYKQSKKVFRDFEKAAGS